MLKSNDTPQTFLRYGLPRTKELLKDLSRVYDGIVIPANILLYQYKGTPAIIYHLNRPFFIDPMSYLFAQPFEAFKKKLEKGNAFKPSFEKLLIGYGVDPKKFLNDNSKLTAYLAASKNNLHSFVNNCLDFQINKIEETILSAQEYVDVSSSASLKPIFIIPPYFLFRENDPESALNFDILDYCEKSDKWNTSDIFPLVFIDQNSLKKPQYLTELLSKLNSYKKFKGFTIWVNNFEERYADQDEIGGFINLVLGLSQKGNKQVIMLYGGFFSLLLYKLGMNCVCHGLAYSEHRNLLLSLSQNSGPAPIRYYITDLHQFVTIENAVEILRVRDDLICSCPICQRLIQGVPENVVNFQDEENLAIMHFLYNRNEEKKLVASLDTKGIISYLEYLGTVNNSLNTLTKKVVTGDKSKEKSIIDVSSLENWKQAIVNTIR